MMLSPQDSIRQIAYEQVAACVSKKKKEPGKDLNDTFVTFRIGEDGHIVKTKTAAQICEREGMIQAFLEKVMKRNAAEWKLPIDCEFSIGLHDAYYETDYVDIFVFSKRQGLDGQILIPDLYAMAGYGGRLDTADNMRFEDKIRKAFFIGCTTGLCVPSENRRLRLCQWAHENSNHAECYISNVVQMSYDDVFRAFPKCPCFVRPPMHIQDQRQFQFLINMDGNTCAWDRLPWIMSSCSVAVKERTRNINWYYPLMQENMHYLGFTEFDEIPHLIATLEEDDAKRIILNANQFVTDYLNLDAHMYYMANVLHFYTVMTKDSKTEAQETIDGLQ